MKLHFLWIASVWSAAICFSCSHALPDNPEPPKSEPEPVPITVGDLKIVSYAIAADDNPHIYADFPFVCEDDGALRGRIEHYETPLAGLVASFEAVAARVTVNGAEQLSGATVNDFSSPVVYRLYADDGAYKEFTVVLEQGAATGFPIVSIRTDGGRPVVSRDEWLGGTLTLDPQKSGCDPLASAIEIKGRGHNSWSADKKPYAIRLAEKSAVMGMPKHKRWVLLANAKDRTLLRNRTAYEIGRRTQLAWTPDNRFVEVVLNGAYLGSYLLCEQIRVDKNRLNITEMEAGDIEGEALTGGYLLELDRYYDEANKFRTTLRDLPVNIKEPDEKVLTPEQKAYISGYLDWIEQLLYGGSAPDPSYADFLDVDSFIDWWIVVELTHNRDTRLPGSCYMYKDRGGKLCAGPLWDFDLTTFIDATGFLLEDYETVNQESGQGDRSLWYKRLFADPSFRAKAKQRWQTYKPEFETIVSFIGDEAERLHPSAEANWALWTLTAGSNRDEALEWADAVERMKENYARRLDWMDRTIRSW